MRDGVRVAVPASGLCVAGGIDSLNPSDHLECAPPL